MSKKSLVLGVAVLAVAALGLGLWAYDQVLGETEAPSRALAAIPVATQAADSGDSEDLLVYQLSSDNAQVSFSLSEELRGSPVTVVGVTDQVAGEIALDVADLSAARVGTIQVNARALATDNDQRNRALRNAILQTDTYELITFTPTQVTGLSGAAEAGQTYAFQIAGDLTIRNVTQPVVFDVTVQAETATQLTGTASAVIQRSDFGLTIPSVPGVANVGEDVTLEITFTAEGV
jgi:polyisoprenoid-binding protein YceI